MTRKVFVDFTPSGPDRAASSYGYHQPKAGPPAMPARVYVATPATSAAATAAASACRRASISVRHRGSRRESVNAFSRRSSLTLRQQRHSQSSTPRDSTHDVAAQAKEAEAEVEADAAGGSSCSLPVAAAAAAPPPDAVVVDIPDGSGADAEDGENASSRASTVSFDRDSTNSLTQPGDDDDDGDDDESPVFCNVTGSLSDDTDQLTIKAGDATSVAKVLHLTTFLTHTSFPALSASGYVSSGLVSLALVGCPLDARAVDAVTTHGKTLAHLHWVGAKVVGASAATLEALLARRLRSLRTLTFRPPAVSAAAAAASTAGSSGSWLGRKHAVVARGDHHHHHHHHPHAEHYPHHHHGPPPPSPSAPSRLLLALLQRNCGIEVLALHGNAHDGLNEALEAALGVRRPATAAGATGAAAGDARSGVDVAAVAASGVEWARRKSAQLAAPLMFGHGEEATVAAANTKNAKAREQQQQQSSPQAGGRRRARKVSWGDQKFREARDGECSGCDDDDDGGGGGEEDADDVVVVTSDGRPSGKSADAASNRGKESFFHTKKKKEEEEERPLSNLRKIYISGFPISQAVLSEMLRRSAATLQAVFIEQVDATMLDVAEEAKLFLDETDSDVEYEITLKGK